MSRPKKHLSIAVVAAEIGGHASVPRPYGSEILVVIITLSSAVFKNCNL
jgi:hypothetical protein